MSDDAAASPDPVIQGRRVEAFRRALAPLVVVIGDDPISRTIVERIGRAGLSVATLKSAVVLRALIARGAPSLIIAPAFEKGPVGATVRQYRKQDSEGRFRPALLTLYASPSGLTEIDAASTNGRAQFFRQTVPSTHIFTQLGGAIAHALSIEAPGRHLTTALGTDDSVMRAADGLTELDVRLKQHREEVERVLGWQAPLITYEGDALVVRITLDGFEHLRATISVRLESVGTLPTSLELDAALPVKEVGTSTIAPERGLSGFISSIGEIELDEPALDKRFIISRDKVCALEWRPLVQELTVLSTHGEVNGSLSSDRVAIRISGMGVCTVGECVSSLRRLWQKLTHNRLGIVDDGA